MDTSAVKDSYEKARRLLLNDNNQPTDYYRAYLNYQKAYQEKKMILENAQTSAMSDPKKLQNWPIAGVHYAQEVNQAWDNWVALGYKQTVEQAIALLKAFKSPETASVLQA